MESPEGAGRHHISDSAKNLVLPAALNVFELALFRDFRIRDPVEVVWPTDVRFRDRHYSQARPPSSISYSEEMGAAIDGAKISAADAVVSTISDHFRDSRPHYRHGRIAQLSPKIARIVSHFDGVHFRFLRFILFLRYIDQNCRLIPNGAPRDANASNNAAYGQTKQPRAKFGS